MGLNPDFKEFLQLLSAHNVRYLVVGGYAVAFHGYPRYTKDIDIWIENTPENASRLLQVLEEFGFGSLGLKVEDFLEPDTIIQLGYAPNRIDLLTSIPASEFSKCYEQRVDAEIEGILVHFINLSHLIQSKRASGRHQDLADIENLQA